MNAYVATPDIAQIYKDNKKLCDRLSKHLLEVSDES